MRLQGGTVFPMPMAIAATGRTQDAYDLGRITALEARAVGIHQTYSPVADLNNTPENPIINTRAFGEDPGDASRLIRAGMAVGSPMRPRTPDVTRTSNSPWCRPAGTGWTRSN